MSLLRDSMTEMVLLEKTREPDGEGGSLVAWKEGMHFPAAVSFDLSMQARIGQAQVEVGRYTVLTVRSMTLEYHDVFRRISDGKIFRVTSDGDDKATPKGAGLDIRAVSAEEWRLPV